MSKDIKLNNSIKQVLLMVEYYGNSHGKTWIECASKDEAIEILKLDQGLIKIAHIATTELTYGLE